MMEPVINNISDLRAEIELLRASKHVQEEAIKSHFSSPAAIFHTVTSWFKSSPSNDRSVTGILGGGQDMVSLISRFVLPFVLNKTLFRGSNFIIKAIVGVVSQQASGFINEKSVASVWGKLKSVIPNLMPKKKVKKVPVDYGIPPYSESY
jgi:hypothetical protein